MTSSPAAVIPARRLIPALADADDALTAHADARPAEITVWAGPVYEAAAAQWRAWSAEHNQLGTLRDAALRDARGLICQRCTGTGMTQFRHRSGGTCYQCGGDGWTAKGRRLHTKESQG